MSLLAALLWLATTRQVSTIKDVSSEMRMVVDPPAWPPYETEQAIDVGFMDAYYRYYPEFQMFVIELKPTEFASARLKPSTNSTTERIEKP